MWSFERIFFFKFRKPSAQKDGQINTNWRFIIFVQSFPETNDFVPPLKMEIFGRPQIGKLSEKKVGRFEYVPQLFLSNHFSIRFLEKEPNLWKEMAGPKIMMPIVYSFHIGIFSCYTVSKFKSDGQVTVQRPPLLCTKILTGHVKLDVNIWRFQCIIISVAPAFCAFDQRFRIVWLEYHCSPGSAAFNFIVCFFIRIKKTLQQISNDFNYY